MIRIHIKQSKTNSFRQDVLYLGKTNNVICPINSLVFLPYHRKGTLGPMFVMENGHTIFNMTII